jgi:hypothetical protein
MKATSIVQVENERVIVTEWRFAPGADTGQGVKRPSSASQDTPSNVRTGTQSNARPPAQSGSARSSPNSLRVAKWCCRCTWCWPVPLSLTS